MQIEVTELLFAVSLLILLYGMGLVGRDRSATDPRSLRSGFGSGPLRNDPAQDHGGTARRSACYRRRMRRSFVARCTRISIQHRRISATAGGYE